MSAQKKENGPLSGLPPILELVERFSKNCSQSPANNLPNDKCKNEKIECKLPPTENKPLAVINSASDKKATLDTGITVSNSSKNDEKKEKIGCVNNAGAIRKEGAKMHCKAVPKGKTESAYNIKNGSAMHRKKLVSATSCEDDVDLLKHKDSFIPSVKKRTARKSFKSKAKATDYKEGNAAATSRSKFNSDKKHVSGLLKQVSVTPDKNIGDEESNVSKNKIVEFDSGEMQVSKSTAQFGAIPCMSGADFQAIIDCSLTDVVQGCLLNSFKRDWLLLLANLHYLKLTVKDFYSNTNVSTTFSDYLRELEQVNSRKTTDWYELSDNFKEDLLHATLKDFVYCAITCAFPEVKHRKGVMKFKRDYYEIMNSINEKLSPKEFYIMQKVCNRVENKVFDVNFTSRVLTFVALLVLFDEYQNM